MSRCLAPTLLMAVTLAAAAHAAVPGHALVVMAHCGSDDGRVAIAEKPTLSGAVEVQGATGGVENADGTVQVTAACGGDLDLHVPPGFPVTVDASGSAALELRDLGGPLTVSLRDDATMKAGHLQHATLNLIGNGDARIAALTGPAVLMDAGSSDVSVARVETSSLVVTDSGSGDFSFGGGRIGHLKATVAGSGDLDFRAIVDNGEVVSAGSGDVTIARVTGALTEVRTGSGDIDIGARGSGGRDLTDAKSARPATGANLAPVAILPPLALLFFFWLRRRQRRDRNAKAALSATGASDARISQVTERLATLSRRVGRVEALVTSREFELERRFRDFETR